MPQLPLSPSRWDISHTTDINAPMDVVWAELINIDDWEWNKWTRLEAEGAPREGLPGELKASYDGDGEWKTFQFKFGEVNDKDHVLTWSGKVGPNGFIFSGRHTMRLKPLNEYTTRLHHEERFAGVLPALGLGLPYKTLNRNYLLMNVGLKAHVEAKIAPDEPLRKPQRLFP